MIKRVLLFAALISSASVFSQTVGLLSASPSEIQDGYNLFFPHNQTDVFLIDNCGRLVQNWEGDTYGPGNGVYLSEAGLLYKCISQGAISNPDIHAGGGGEGLEIRNWNNEIVWQWFYNDETVRLHHDIAVMPNGNILAIAWERFSEEEALAQGRDPEFMTEREVWPDHIIEVEPVGTDQANIVWEWHAWDHMVQDYDELLPNFGVVSEHPELIDLNYGLDGDADWHHANSIDYNPDFDQVILSVPHFSELWIIDHSTTTAQAATNSGGLVGKGGDLIYRWGNPQAYDRGTADDQQLFFQHDVHWMDHELSQGDPGYNKVMIFNNRVGEDFSSVEIITPIFDTYYWDYLLTTETYTPASPEWTYTRDTPQDLHSTGLSSAQRLPNGNTLICSGRHGYNFEVNDSGDVIWEYVNPLLAGEPVSQGTEIDINGNIMFRMARYSPAYPGFDGQDLVPGEYIELDPTTECFLSIDEEEVMSNLGVYPNPSSDGIFYLESDQPLAQARVVITDLSGRQMLIAKANYGRVDCSQLASGIYTLQLEGVNAEPKLIVIK